MKIIASRRDVVLGLGASALTACSPKGTFLGQAETRPSDRPAEGGVGGTGVVGILIGQTRLLVNGLSLAAGDAVTVRDAFGPRRLDELAVGQSLTVEAADDSGRLVARSIAMVQPLIGPIEAITGSGIRSLGVAVTIEPGAVLARADGSPFTPATGQRVAVSGLWRGDGVVASRIDLLDQTDAPVVVAGEVKPGAASGNRRLGSLELVLPTDAEAPALGSFVTVIGRRNGAALIAERVAAGRFQGTAGPLTRLSVEGYLEPIVAAPGYAVSGLGHSFDTEARLAALAAERALFVGTYDGAFRVRFGLPLREDLAARSTQLAAIEDGFAPGGAVSTR